VLSRDKQQITDANKASFILGTLHQPGALHTAMGAFANNDINLSKIESRPVVSNDHWRYIFYIDVEASENDPRCKAAIEVLESLGDEHICLGSYVRATLPNGIR
jgi:prephenate dehydratase